MAINNTAYPSIHNGGYITSTGTSATSYTSSWATPNTNFNDGNSPVMTIPQGGKTVILEEKATLEVKGTVKINGLDLEERLNTIEKVLCIPKRDAIMEAKYPRLKKIFDEYIHELEKAYTWERLKGTDND